MWWILLALVAGLLWIAQKRRHSFWSRRGVPSLSPHPLFGNMKDVFLLRKTETEVVDELYRKSSSLPYLGVYRLWRPQLLINDLDLVKSVLISQFDSFPNQIGICGMSSTDRIVWSLFLMRDQEWRVRRALLNTIFTPKRIKSMFPSILENCNRLMTILDEEAEGEIELESVIRRYAINIITSCLFGMDTDTLENANSVFIRCGKMFGQPSPWTVLKVHLFNQAPALYRFLGLTSFDPGIWRFFHSFIKDVVQEREKNNCIGDDLLGVLIKMKNDPEPSRDSADKFYQRMTLEEITGHAYVFFDAGYDTTTLITSFCLYELSINTEIQDKLRAEVQTVMEEHDNLLTYEVIQSLNFMDQVLTETLRKYPPVGVLKRESSQSCVLSGTSLRVPKGMQILIPAYSIHYDPQYFPNPDRFDPGRFPDRKANSPPEKSPPIQHYSFGKGPRMCIGFKMAELEIKLAVASLLLKYELKRSEKMAEPIEYDPSGVIISGRPKHGIWVRVNHLP